MSMGSRYIAAAWNGWHITDMGIGYLKNNKGMTMSEVIIAFLILMICAGVLSGCLGFASNMLGKAKDTDVAHSDYQEKAVLLFNGREDVLSGEKGPFDIATEGRKATYRFRTFTYEVEPVAKDVTYENAEGETESRGITVFSTINLH
ncbi:MAG: prepilin-type N-terminal cleavage/methylation domain-containing protein [Lachnospiraceae bacterium]|nr:prepilin-type N-terminal cleavage/methylation domain-containing protein [Lachnospiraceae bacterium]MCR4936878.1 prepilin-type N-terminal cleavage/methylation domain-containing protein [Lachnospiraceae bacterium]